MEYSVSLVVQSALVASEEAELIEILYPSSSNTA